MENRKCASTEELWMIFRESKNPEKFSHELIKRCEEAYESERDVQEKLVQWKKRVEGYADKFYMDWKKGYIRGMKVSFEESGVVPIEVVKNLLEQNLAGSCEKSEELVGMIYGLLHNIFSLDSKEKVLNYTAVLYDLLEKAKSYLINANRIEECKQWKKAQELVFDVTREFIGKTGNKTEVEMILQDNSQYEYLCIFCQKMLETLSDVQKVGKKKVNPVKINSTKTNSKKKWLVLWIVTLLVGILLIGIAGVSGYFIGRSVGYKNGIESVQEESFHEKESKRQNTSDSGSKGENGVTVGTETDN